MVTFTPALTGTVGQSTTLSATASSGLTAITFASSTPTICTVSGTTANFLAVGTCTVTANQAGNNDFNAATQVPANIVVSTAAKKDQTISFSPALTGTVGTTANLSATASSGLTAITFASSPSTICTISGNSVSFVSAGNCIVTANQVGNDKFNAAKEVSATIVVSAAQIVKKDQVLTLTSTDGTAGETITLTATSDSALTDITFASLSPMVCDVNGSNASLKAEGTCIVAMKQAGNTQFNSVESQGSILVKSAGVFSLNITDNNDATIIQTLEGQSIKISATIAPKVNDAGKSAKIYLKASMGDISLMLTPQGLLAAKEPLTAFTSMVLPTNGSVSIPLYEGPLPVGQYSIYAVYETDTKVEATSIFSVKKPPQPVTFVKLPVSKNVGETFELETEGGILSAPVILGSLTSDVCSMGEDKKTISFIAEGKCSISATQQGTNDITGLMTVADISVKSSGAFSVKIADSNGQPIDEPKEGEFLKISLDFKAPTDEVGQLANFYLTASSETVNLMYTLDRGWIPATDPPAPVITSVKLPQGLINLSLYEGYLPNGNYAISSTYEINSNRRGFWSSIKKAVKSVVKVVKKSVSAVANATGKAFIYVGEGTKIPIVASAGRAFANAADKAGRAVNSAFDVVANPGDRDAWKATFVDAYAAAMAYGNDVNYSKSIAIAKLVAKHGNLPKSVIRALEHVNMALLAM